MSLCPASIRGGSPHVLPGSWKHPASTGGSPCGDPGSSSSSSSLVHAGLSLHEGFCSTHGSPSSLPPSAVLPHAAPSGTQVVTQGRHLHSCSPPARGSGRLPLPASTCCSVTSGGRKPGTLSPRLSAQGSLSHCVGDERSSGFEPSTCSMRSHHGQAPPRTPAPARQHPPERSALPAQKCLQSGFRRRADPSPVIMPPCPLQLPSLLIRCRFHKLRFSSTNI